MVSLNVAKKFNLANMLEIKISSSNLNISHENQHRSALEQRF